MGIMSNLRAALRGRTREDIEFDYLNQSTSQVDLVISATPLDGGRMQLDVTNSVAGSDPQTAPKAPAHQGTGLGLTNVCQRLEAHFGAAADCRFGPIPGGYKVSLAMPVEDDD